MNASKFEISGRNYASTTTKYEASVSAVLPTDEVVEVFGRQYILEGLSASAKWEKNGVYTTRKSIYFYIQFNSMLKSGKKGNRFEQKEFNSVEQAAEYTNIPVEVWNNIASALEVEMVKVSA